MTSLCLLFQRKPPTIRCRHGRVDTVTKPIGPRSGPILPTHRRPDFKLDRQPIAKPCRTWRQLHAPPAMLRGQFAGGSLSGQRWCTGVWRLSRCTRSESHPGEGGALISGASRFRLDHPFQSSWPVFFSAGGLVETFALPAGSLGRQPRPKTKLLGSLGLADSALDREPHF